MCSDEAVSRLLIEYDGTDFSGWARQPGRRTVQGELESALGTILRRDAVALTVAGRTDAGVHALGQVASYAGEPARVAAVNALLAPDVAVLACDPAPAGFSARHDATSRAYRYRLLCRRARSPFASRYALHWPHELDVRVLQACAERLPGRHDFTAFTPRENSHTRFEREVLAARWVSDGDRVEFVVEADAFMRSMVRVLVGTMLEVGSGRRAASQFAELLEGRPRIEAGETAPAHGLTLIGVGYDHRPVLGSGGRGT